MVLQEVGEVGEGERSLVGRTSLMEDPAQWLSDCSAQCSRFVSLNPVLYLTLAVTTTTSSLSKRDLSSASAVQTHLNIKQDK